MVTVAVSLATYLESPLLYSFPAQHSTREQATARTSKTPSGLGAELQIWDTIEPGNRRLTDFVEVIGVLFGEEAGGEDAGPLDEEVGEPGERPPAHEQAVGLG